MGLEVSCTSVFSMLLLANVSLSVMFGAAASAYTGGLFLADSICTN